MAGEAHIPPGLDAVMAVLGRKMGNTRDQSPELGKLRHTFIHANRFKSFFLNREECLANEPYR